MEEKIKALKIPKGFACLPVLIHVNGVTRAVNEAGYFASIVDFSESLTEGYDPRNGSWRRQIDAIF